MFVIVVYDVAVERQNYIRKLLKNYLFHRQRSVFDGFLSKAQILFLKKQLEKIVKEDDQIVFYLIDHKSCIKEIIKISKKEDNTEDFIV